MHSKMVFNKPPLPIPEQIHHLRQKGLLLDNEQEASHYLTVIGYYRLMIYFKPFLLKSETGIRQFKPNTQFSDLLNLYVFDRELRLLVTDALERIEVSFRTAISNAMSLKYGAHWYLCADLFSSIEQHHRTKVTHLNIILPHILRTTL
jgi:abortive infection bacteriophage resistance protein